QSVAVRMMVQRERERMAFKSGSWWDLKASAEKDRVRFDAALTSLGGRTIASGRDFDETTGALKTGKNVLLLDEAESRALATRLAGCELVVDDVDRKESQRSPYPPFTTSTLQQESNRKLGFSASQTMQIAQKLYESGHITYMRTDSVGLAKEAIDDIRGLIVERYGKASLPAQPNVYKTTAKNAQEAHEGIRPTSIRRTPESLQRFLSDEQYKLYSLIWKRTIASQMEPAVYDQLAVDLVPAQRAEAGRFRASGSTLVSPGFIAVYLEGRDDDGDDNNEVKLPAVHEGDILSL
ncbi:MAG: DNA topoisomerase I, partial [Gammaproteobacteria bacterium]|nr:DNA topoisomerase I [Gammaproteobacteria bacterium]